MHTLNEVKTYGGVGSLLLLLAFVPTVGFILAIAGAILVLVAVKYASDIFGDPKIFNNMLFAIILGVVALVIGVVAVVAVVFQAIGLGYLSSSFVAVHPTANMGAGNFIGIVSAVLLGLAAVWVCLLLSSIFVRRSYSELGKRLNVGMFGTAALLYLIGAALAIVIVGFVLIFIAEILLVVAFFSINTQMPMNQPMQPAQPTT
ncbi:MAG: DUF996 domain-containing protein [Thaumarchaeota archaeon]|nr:DUF996 domain-containing protein [Nitrososphaerota archaeon]